VKAGPTGSMSIKVRATRQREFESPGTDEALLDDRQGIVPPAGAGAALTTMPQGCSGWPANRSLAAAAIGLAECAR
jgi:hypothetical protein